MRIVLLITIALLIPILPFVVIGELPGERWLSAFDDNALLFGITAAGLLAGDILLPVPSSIIGTLLGARMGFMSGWLFAWFGLVTGSMIGYFVGRIALARLNTELPETITAVTLFVSRPVPVLAEAIAFAAGASRMPLTKFLAVSIAGNGLYALVLTANGASLLADQWISAGLIIPFALPVLAWLIWQYATRTRRQRQP